MPLAGGEADKIGNRYEARWTIHCIIDVMEEKADSIRLEPPGEDAFEFFLRRDRLKEYHQVKRQKTGLGHWTLKSLETKQIGVISDIWDYLQRQDVTCVFVSTQDANELRELANRAKDAKSFAEFERKFLNGKGILGKFHTLCQKWRGCSPQSAYEALKRVLVTAVDEKFLVDSIENRLTTLVEADPKTIRIELAELILNSIRKELTAHDIWHYLSRRGYRRREWGKDPHVLATVENTNHRYVARLKEIAIADKIISRDETEAIVSRLRTTTGKRAALITGEAGIGKSVVMLQVLESLLEEGIPVLSMRVDNLKPVNHPNKVGKQLQLPGSPANVLAGIAQNRECVLVIDQLDAVSSTSGRHPDFFECINEIIQQASSHPNIRLLIACRKFDLDNDHRLKKLTGDRGIAETIVINRLSHDKVKEVVTELKLDATRLDLKQLDLLSVPLHLWLLSQIADDLDSSVLNFQTAKDLYDRLWDYKPRKLRERLGRDLKWTQVIERISDRMSDKQSLSVPQIIVDEFKTDVEAMISEHILVEENNRLRFFHDSFFDYAFARRFAARGQDLLSLLYTDEQHLFRRTQVRQILIHEREADFDLYLDHLEELLASKTVRFHLKQVVFAWLGTLNDPQEGEWEILSSAIEQENTSLSNFAWIVLQSSAGWFKLLDSLGLITQWLNSDAEKNINRAISLMWKPMGEVSDRIAELLTPFVSVSDKWLSRIGTIIIRAKIAQHRSLFELFLNLIEQGFFDNKGHTHEGFWSEIANLPRQNSEWACEAIGFYLDRHLRLSLRSGFYNPLDWQAGSLSQDTFYKDVLAETAKHSPAHFIQNTLPFFLRILDTEQSQSEHDRYEDPFWLYQAYGSGHNILDCLIDSIKVSLCSLAKSDSAKCIEIIERDLRNLQLSTVQYLVHSAYASNTEAFLAQIFDYICHQLSSAESNFSGSNDSQIKKIIYEITSSCSSEQLEKIESLILDYYPDWEKPSNRYANFGYSQFILLSAIDPNRRSTKVIRRINELTRKFGELPQETSCFASRTIIATDTPSPIPLSALEKMTDEQLLKAIAKYSAIKAPFRKNGRSVSVGVFIQDLEERAKQEPVRFADLIWQLEDSINSNFFNAILRGIAKTEVQINVETAFSVCKRCNLLPQQPCDRNICYLISGLAELSWSKEAFDLVIDIALHNRDPEPKIFCNEKSSKQSRSARNILLNGMNYSRGAAVQAIASLIFADKTRGAYFRDSLEEIAVDKSMAVKACAAQTLTAMLNYDRDIAVNLFIKLCNSEDVLLGTQTVDRFLYRATYTHFEALKPVLERMVDSDFPEVAEVGALTTCVEALRIESARYLVDRSLSKTTNHKKALAEVLVANLKFAHLSQYCQAGLVKLFNDDEQDVRVRASRCFLKLEQDELKDYTDLVDKFVDSLAFESNCHSLIRALETTTTKLPKITYLVCDRFVRKLEARQSQQQSYVRDGDRVSRLLIRIYSQSRKKMQTKCLDLIDRLSEMNVHQLGQAIDEYEK